MGVAKTEWMETEARGWDSIEKSVCQECVSDLYLKSLIAASADTSDCDYCGESGDDTFAAPVDQVLAAVMVALNYYYAEPTAAGAPYESAEGGWQAEITDTVDALLTLPLECDDDLFEDIVGAISAINDTWVSAADGHWAGEHKHLQLTTGWQRFVNHVKHRQRYFFSSANGDFGPDIEPSYLLPELASVVCHVGLIDTLREGITLYRARVIYEGEAWPLDADNLGAAPQQKAAAGRMNPAGIPYLYVALDQQTALAEVLRGPPSEVAVGTFTTLKPLRVLNLIDIPRSPSIFDHERSRERELILFLRSFVEEISRPVSKDGAEHINYVPSQVICEYFASIFQPEDPLVGILYTSAVQIGGRNLVLFPQYEYFKNQFPHAKFIEGHKVRIDNWLDITAALDPEDLPLLGGQRTD